MLAAGMHDNPNHRTLFLRVGTGLAMTEAAFVETRRRLQ